MCRSKSNVGRDQRRETPDEQTRADEQHTGETYGQDHEAALDLNDVRIV